MIRLFSAIVLSIRPVLGYCVIGGFFGAFAAHVPDVKTRLGVDDGTFGLLLFGSAIGLLGAVVVAPLLDPILRHRTLALATLTVAVAFPLAMSATWWPVFMFWFVVIGIGAGSLDILVNARVSDLEAIHRRPLMNANHGMFSLCYAATALVSGATREAGIDQVVTFGVLGVIAAALATQMLVGPAGEDDAGDDAGRGLPLGPVLICGTIVLLAFFTEGSIEAWSALHIERTLGGRAAEGAVGPAILGLTMAAGRFFGQTIAERFADRAVIWAASLLAGGGMVVAALAATPAIAYLGFGLAGLGISVIGPLGIAAAGRMVAPRLRTRAISRAAMMGFGAFLVGPVIIGQLSEGFGLPVAFLFVAVTLLALFPLAARLPP